MMRSETNRLPRPSVVASWILGLFIAVLVLSIAQPASAKSGFLGDFNTRYGTAGTPLDSCSLCHTSVPSLNPYGSDWTGNSKNFAAIEGMDSDGDGASNIAEIQARTMPGNASSTPPPPTTTTQPPTSTTQPPATTTTTAPPSTTTTLPPSGSGPLSFQFKEFNPPGSVDVTSGSVSRSIKVKVDVSNAPRDSDVRADIQLWANGQLAETITRTRGSEDDGDVEYEVEFNFTFNTSHVPRVDWWVIVVINGQASSPATDSTTITGPAPPTTTTQPPTSTTQPPTSTTRPPTSTTQPPSGGGLDGAAIYAASCAGCHGSDGSGGFGGPVAGTSMSLSQVINITANGAGTMPAFSGQLSSPQIDAVSAYVLTLGGGSGTPPPPATTTTLPSGTPPGSGAALYSQHCAGCHGANADGGAGGALVGSALSFAQQVAVTSNGVGTMPAFSSVLSGSEINSIITYVGGLSGPGSPTTTTVPPNEESGSAIYSRLCAACHGRDGSGGSGGPILGTNYHGLALGGVITDGLGSMPGFGAQLNDGQLSRLVSFVEGLASGEIAVADDGSVLGEDGLVDPAEGFQGHISETDGSVEATQDVALGSEVASSSPLPVGNPVGWTLALAIAAFFVAVGSAVTGAMPREAEERTAG